MQSLLGGMTCVFVSRYLAAITQVTVPREGAQCVTYLFSTSLYI